MPSLRTLFDRSAPTPRVGTGPRYWHAAGLLLAALMLLAFYMLVRGAVQKAETDRDKLRVAGQREATCRGAAAGGARDLCMLGAAVPAKLGIPGGSQTLGSIEIQSRAH